MIIKTLLFIPLFVFSLGNVNAQTIVFSSDSTDATKTVTELTIDKQVYMHITFLKPLDKTTLFDFSEFPPKSRKYRKCGFDIKIYPKNEEEPRYEKILSYNDYGNKDFIAKVDFSSNKVVLPLLPKNGWSRDSFVKFFNELKVGTEAYSIVIVPTAYGDVAKKKVRPRGEISIIKKPNDFFKYNRSFEATYKASMTDPVIEEKVLFAINEKAENAEWKRVYKKVKISSRDWKLIRDQYTDVVIGRAVLCYCYAKLDTGECKVYEYWFWQEFDGQNYSKSIFYYNKTETRGAGELVDCAID